MDDFRPLREQLDAVVAGDRPSADLAALPGDLFGAAVAGYSDTAPVEVAEHLEPFVTAVTAGDAPDPAVGLDLLASVPPSASDEDVAADLPEPFAGDLDFGAGDTAGTDAEPSFDVAEQFEPSDTAEFGPVETAEPASDSGGTESWLDVSLLDSGALGLGAAGGNDSGAFGFGAAGGNDTAQDPGGEDDPGPL